MTEKIQARSLKPALIGSSGIGPETEPLGYAKVKSLGFIRRSGAYAQLSNPVVVTVHSELGPGDPPASDLWQAQMFRQKMNAYESRFTQVAKWR